ncbi:SDR family NAD(P)-dependent oxidoreductase [Streptomyces stramineus]
MHLDRLGFRVHAGVRKAADGEQLAAEARHGLIHPLTLDLTSEESVREAAASVAAAEGRGGLWGLVNNAGICVSAPLEGVPAEQLRAQLDVNVVGTVLVTQSFLPGLRRARGRVVNVTSGLGSVAIPTSAPTPPPSSPRKPSATRSAASCAPPASPSRWSSPARS